MTFDLTRMCRLNRGHPEGMILRKLVNRHVQALKKTTKKREPELSLSSR